MISLSADDRIDLLGREEGDISIEITFGSRNDDRLLDWIN